MSCFEEQWQKVSALCMGEISKNPIEIMCKLMDLEFCSIKGHEHHMMVGAALLTAYFNSLNKGNSTNAAMNLSEAFHKLESLSEFTVGGDCDYWNGCEIVSGVRAFWSVVSERNELTDKLSMETSNAIGSVCGSRCCKRSAYLAISKVVDFVKLHLQVEMESEKFTCRYSGQNNNCLSEDCPYNEHYIEYL